jgi:hypothetical protein
MDRKARRLVEDQHQGVAMEEPLPQVEVGEVDRHAIPPTHDFRRSGFHFGR